jgi:hypothetical protein
LIRLSVLLSIAAVLAAQSEKTFRVQIPRTWDDAAMADVELPLARAEHSLRQVSSEYYYRIPVRPVYKTYPVYARDREPSGYLDWLRQKESAYVFDASNLRFLRL